MACRIASPSAGCQSSPGMVVSRKSPQKKVDEAPPGSRSIAMESRGFQAPVGVCWGTLADDDGDAGRAMQAIAPGPRTVTTTDAELRKTTTKRRPLRVAWGRGQAKRHINILEPESFVGTWALSSSDRFDELLVVLGVEAVKRRIAKGLRPVQTWVLVGDVLQFSVQSPMGLRTESFPEGGSSAQLHGAGLAGVTRVSHPPAPHVQVRTCSTASTGTPCASRPLSRMVCSQRWWSCSRRARPGAWARFPCTCRSPPYPVTSSTLTPRPSRAPQATVPYERRLHDPRAAGGRRYGNACLHAGGRPERTHRRVCTPGAQACRGRAAFKALLPPPAAVVEARLLEQPVQVAGTDGNHVACRQLEPTPAGFHGHVGSGQVHQLRCLPSCSGHWLDEAAARGRDAPSAELVLRGRGMAL